MVEFELDLKKSLGENISDYFSEIKKLKAKVSSANEVIALTKKQLEDEMKKAEYLETSESEKTVKKTHKEWYYKFRWFYTSSGKFVVAGRDATTNEILIKKYTDSDDIVFHTNMPGSPFAVVKAKDSDLSEKDIEEIANFIVTYSKAWKSNISTMEVFYVPASNVTKQTKSGEYMSKGSFMIYGKKSYALGRLDLAIGINTDGELLCGPMSAVSSRCKKYVVIVPGRKKTSDVAKKISRFLGFNDINEIVRLIPAGGCDITARRVEGKG